jgi:Amt family ammonium transporter
MRDFSGSTVMHSFGGWVALAGAIVVGPRLGRYPPGSRPATVPGHNMGYVFLGGMILWLGWFGFNPGSTMAVDPEAIARIAVTTNLAACAGTLYSWARHGKPDFSLTVNGCLAGLVSITAIKKAMGLRVSEADEIAGLDVAEMRAEAYPESPPEVGPVLSG